MTVLTAMMQKNNPRPKEQLLMASEVLDSIPAIPVVHPNGNCFCGCGETMKPARERILKQFRPDQDRRPTL